MSKGLFNDLKHREKVKETVSHREDSSFLYRLGSISHIKHGIEALLIESVS